MSKPRTIVIGDVHGCVVELRELLDELAYSSSDRLVFVGDLMDRGPEPAAAVRLVRELGAECVLGNHDDTHIRWAGHEAKAAADARYRNNMKRMTSEELRQHHLLDDQDWEWLRGLPTSIRLDERWVVVHAGCEPCRTIDEQDPKLLFRVRYVDHSGAYVGKLFNDEAAEAAGTVGWATEWTGPESIIYGHHVHANYEPRINQPVNGVWCYGIDTGCCYGGRLTALVLPERRIVQVAAKRTYAQQRAPSRGEST
jgi:hypothetical protein